MDRSGRQGASYINSAGYVEVEVGVMGRVDDEEVDDVDDERDRSVNDGWMVDDGRRANDGLVMDDGWMDEEDVNEVTPVMISRGNNRHYGS